MNRIVLIVCSLFMTTSLTACAAGQPRFRDSMPYDEQHIVYINTQPHKKAEAFVIVNHWVAMSYNSAQKVIQMNDKEAGAMIVKAAYPFTLSVPAPLLLTSVEINGWVNYTVSIQVKDQKIRMEFVTDRITWPPDYLREPQYYPEENMPELRAYYKGLHDDLLFILMNKEKDF